MLAVAKGFESNHNYVSRSHDSIICLYRFPNFYRTRLLKLSSLQGVSIML